MVAHFAAFLPLYVIVAKSVHKRAYEGQLRLVRDYIWRNCISSPLELSAIEPVCFSSWDVVHSTTSACLFMVTAYSVDDQFFVLIRCQWPLVI